MLNKNGSGKLVLIILVCITITSFTSNTSIAKSELEYKNGVESDILKTINGYFKIQLESLKNKDSVSTRQLDKFIDTSLKSGRILYDYKVGKIGYLLESYNLDNTIIEDYNFYVECDNIYIKEDRANVKLLLREKIKYNFMHEYFTDTVEHEISLIKRNNKWLIIEDDYSTEFKDIYDLNYDFDSAKEMLKKEYDMFNKIIIQELGGPSVGYDEKLQSNKLWVSYSNARRQNAVNYGLKYTDNTGRNCKHSSFDRTYNKRQFKVYGCNDCQNYVSQALWYGFGGRNSGKKDYPMNSNWWANTTGEARTWNWTGTSQFRSYIINNRKNNRYGIHGASYKSPTNMSIGDYIYVPGHVYLITKIGGTGTKTNWKNVYVSAHTNNRKNANLKALYKGKATPPTNMQFMKIYGNLSPNPPRN